MIGTKRDMSDYQWRSFRNSIPIIYTFAFIFLSVSFLIKKYSTIKMLKYFYLAISLGYCIYLHSIKIIFFLSVIIFNFYLTKLYSLLGGKLFTLMT
jgi:hypothetical protein